MMKCFLLSWLLIVGLLVPFSLYADPVNIVYLVIGNGAYAVPPPASSIDRTLSFPQVSSAPWSARRVSYLLASLGAVHGIELIGSPGHFIARQDVFDALANTIEQGRKQANPLVVYYYMGHGISEGFGWNLFSVPGDFIGPPPSLDIEQAAENMVYAAEVVDVLKESGLPFLVLLDHCYEGKTMHLPTGFVVDVAEIVRHMNEFHESYPVLFSTPPGTVVPSVADPNPKVSKNAVGPLARRLLIAMQSFDSEPVPLRELVSMMTDEHGRTPLDNLTSPAITHVNRPLPDLILASHGNPIEPIRFYGTGVKANVTGLSKLEPDDTMDVSTAPRSMKLQLEGVANEFLTDGESYDLLLPASALTITTLKDKRGFELMFEGKNWGTIGFHAPGKMQIQRGTSVATIGSSLWDNSWGFDIGINGRGCSESQGVVTIHDLQWQAGRWESLDLSFEFRCDGDKPIHGHFALEW